MGVIKLHTLVYSTAATLFSAWCKNFCSFVLLIIHALVVTTDGAYEASLWLDVGYRCTTLIILAAVLLINKKMNLKKIFLK